MIKLYKIIQMGKGIHFSPHTYLHIKKVGTSKSKPFRCKLTYLKEIAVRDKVSLFSLINIIRDDNFRRMSWQDLWRICVYKFKSPSTDEVDQSFADNWSITASSETWPHPETSRFELRSTSISRDLTLKSYWDCKISWKSIKVSIKF